MRIKKHFIVEVEYNDDTTNEDGVAVVLDKIIEAAPYKTELRDEYGHLVIGEFFVLSLATLPHL